MERCGWVRRVTLMQSAALVAVFAVIAMHSPPVEQTMPSDQSDRDATISDHMNGSACRTVHEEPAAPPVLLEQPMPLEDLSCSLSEIAQAEPHEPLDRTILGIWRI